MEQLRDRKGFLLTLATVVLVILILGEVLTYVYTNLQYDTLDSQGTLPSASSFLYSSAEAGTPQFLNQSLGRALGALGAYESGNVLLQNQSVASALASLMENGNVFGANMLGYMGAYTLSGYSANIENEANTIGLNVSFSNTSVVVYQSVPYSVNAIYHSRITINASYGTISYPITANGSVILIGGTDPYETGSSFSYSNLSGNLAIGGVRAASGSRSRYMLAYGNLFLYSNVAKPSPACSDILAAVSQNSISHDILATANAMDLPVGVCGALGLVTYRANSTAPARPYLVYASGGNYINGTLGAYANQGVLLDGNSLSLSSIGGISSAIDSGSYLGSGLAPGFLSLLNGSTYAAAPYGAAPLGMLWRQVGSFSPGNSISASGVPVNTVSGGYDTVSFWMRWSGGAAGEVPFGFNSPTTTYYIYIGAQGIGFSTGGGSLLGAEVGPRYGFINGTWVNVVAGFSNGVPSASSSVLYINGVRQQLQVLSGTLGSETASGGVVIGGVDASPYNGFGGQLANVQVYNTLLNQYQALQLYLDGINGLPVNSSLAGWWKLDGNANDYSGRGSTGSWSGGGQYFSTLTGYTGDSFDGGSFYNAPDGRVVGPGWCWGPSNCTLNTALALYAPFEQYPYNAFPARAGVLGTGNATLPTAAYFDSEQNSSVVATNVPLNSAGGQYNTVSFWMYWNAPASGAGTAVWLNGFGLEGNSVDFGFDASGGSGILGVPSSSVSGRWINVIAAFYNGALSASTGNMLIDGVPQALSGGSPGTIGALNPGNVVIGAQPGADAPFSGSIADVQVYNTLLTSAQAADLYLNNSVNGLQPVGYWPLGWGYGGFLNQTQTLYGTSTGYAYRNGIECTESNSIDAVGQQCGIEFLPVTYGG